METEIKAFLIMFGLLVSFILGIVVYAFYQKYRTAKNLKRSEEQKERLIQMMKCSDERMEEYLLKNEHKEIAKDYYPAMKDQIKKP